MFGLTSELPRGPSESQTSRERGKLRKGNTLSIRKTVKELIHQERSLVLPDITTKQLVQQSLNETTHREDVENPLSRTERRLLLRQGRLKESWTLGIEEDLQKLDGLTGCGLLGGTTDDAQSSSAMDDDKRDTRAKSRLSKPCTDSGFSDERLESLTSGEARTTNGSPLSEQRGSRAASSCASDDCPPGPTRQERCRHETEKRTARRLCPSVKETRTSDELRPDDGIARKTRTLQSDCSVWNTAASERAVREADLYSSGSFCSDKGVSRSMYVVPSPGQTVSPSHLVGNVTKVRVERKSLSWPRQDVGISVALLKNRRKLLLRRSGLNNQRHSRDTTETCNPVRVNRVVESKARTTRRPSEDCRQVSPSSDDCPDDMSCVGLTKEIVQKVAGKQSLVDVNTKCQEWLNRWLAVTHTPVEPGAVES